MRKIFIGFSTLFAAFLLASCILSAVGSKLRDLINAEFPPLSVDDARAQSEASLFANLFAEGSPAVGFSIDLDEASERLSEIVIAKEDRISKVSISHDGQLLNIDAIAKLKGNFTNDSANDIEAEVSLSFSAGFEVSQDFDNGKSEYVINLLPAIRNIEVKRISAPRRSDEVIINFMVSLINEFSDTVSGELSRANFAAFSVPASYANIEPERLLTQSSVNTDSKLDFTIVSELSTSVPEVSLALKSTSIPILIHDNRVSGMIMLVAENSSTRIEKPGSFEYNELRQVYYSIFEEAFGFEPNDSGNWIAIRKYSVASNVSEALLGAELCTNFNVSAEAQTLPRERIPPPNWREIPCESKRDCRPRRSCDFDIPVDRRDCRACLARAPRTCLPDTPWGKGSCSGGQCIQRGNDPICELQKGAQNDLYRIEHAGRVADCQRLISQDKLSCEAEKAIENGLCESGKELVKRVSLSGDVGSIGGELGGEANGQLCLSGVSIDDRLARIEYNLSAEAAVDLNGKIEITPLNLGHLVCIAPTNLPLDFELRVPRAAHGGNAEIVFEERDGEYGISYTLSSITIPMTLSPSPVEWILGNVDLGLKCAIANVAKPVLLAAAPFKPELLGRIDYQVPETNGFISIALPSQTIGSTQYIPSADFRNDAILIQYETPN